METNVYFKSILKDKKRKAKRNDFCLSAEYDFAVNLFSKRKKKEMDFASA